MLPPAHPNAYPQHLYTSPSASSREHLHGAPWQKAGRVVRGRAGGRAGHAASWCSFRAGGTCLQLASWHGPRAHAHAHARVKHLLSIPPASSPAGSSRHQCTPQCTPLRQTSPAPPSHQCGPTPCATPLTLHSCNSWPSPPEPAWQSQPAAAALPSTLGGRPAWRPGRACKHTREGGVVPWVAAAYVLPVPLPLPYPCPAPTSSPASTPAPVAHREGRRVYTPACLLGTPVV